MNASIPNRSGSTAAATRREFPYNKLLLAFFLASLPVVNPTVHGDGVGYYAYARAPLIQHDLRFEEDWRRANTRFSSGRVQPDDQLAPSQYTPTGYVDNHFTIGPAILWAPFLMVAHLSVVIWNTLGGKIPADGFSGPYLVAMAVGTAWWGFLGLGLSFSLARKFVRARWAFLATLGVWLASSLPVYMYFNPSWSHAHSAFAVALFVWYWERTRNSRTLVQWIALGLMAGLMIDVYFPNGVFLALPAIEVLSTHYSLAKTATWALQKKLLWGEAASIASMLLALVPTLITRSIIYGGAFRFGAYTSYEWDWRAPHWRQVLFSSDHGALSWTPILALALIGLFAGSRNAKIIAMHLAVCAAAFYYVIATYPFWDGMASFGNRFLISLTAIFIFGLALLFQRFGEHFRDGGRA
ncbi:MAG: hypothetical protein M3P45_13715, partial [Acidobacteriota bacterium]|nr:hypothetical protein [Acidobacteriota bacterium]